MEKISISPDWVFSPQPMYIIGTKNEDGTPNFCIITWLGFSFDNGPHLMMTVGGSKLTKTNILRENKFSANMITEDNLWLADYFGNTNGEDGEKNAVSYSYQWGKVADVPVIYAPYNYFSIGNKLGEWKKHIVRKTSNMPKGGTKQGN